MRGESQLFFDSCDELIQWATATERDLLAEQEEPTTSERTRELLEQHILHQVEMQSRTSYFELTYQRGKALDYAPPAEKRQLAGVSSTLS